MNRDLPDLPGLYELVVVDTTDSARAHAERLAVEGAEEGTVVWAKKQTDGRGRPGKHWISGSRNLHCAVVLRPDEPFTKYCQLSLVTSVCLVQAITVIGEPMEELRLGWPGDVYLNRGKVANIHLSGEIDEEDRVPWMVVAINVNTFDHPTSLGFAASSLRGEGFEVFDREVLLECFARELLSWINRWAEEGLAPVRKAWLWRGDWTDTQRSVNDGEGTHTGVFEAMDDSGALKLRTPEGIMSFDLAAFHRPEFRARP